MERVTCQQFNLQQHVCHLYIVKADGPMQDWRLSHLHFYSPLHTLDTVTTQYRGWSYRAAEKAETIILGHCRLPCGACIM